MYLRNQRQGKERQQRENSVGRLSVSVKFLFLVPGSGGGGGDGGDGGSGGEEFSGQFSFVYRGGLQHHR